MLSIRRGLHASLIGLALLSSAGCGRISSGNVGIKSTYSGTGRGLEGVAVGPAWVGYNPITESVMEYPTFMQSAVWTHNKDEGHPVNEEITFSIKGGTQIAADVSIAYTILPDRVASFYLKFRSADIDGFTHGYLRNLTRTHFDDAAGKYNIDQIMGDNADYLKEVRDSLGRTLLDYGVKLEQLGFIGAPRAPTSIQAGIEAKNLSIQAAIQAENELRSSTAEAAKVVATAKGTAEAEVTVARGQAEANRLLSQSLTPTLVEYKKLEKWNGALPQVSSGGGSGGIILSLPATPRQ